MFPSLALLDYPTHQDESASLEEWCDGGRQRHLPSFVHDHDVKDMPQQQWRVHAQCRGTHLRQVAFNQAGPNETLYMSQAGRQGRCNQAWRLTTPAQRARLRSLATEVSGHRPPPGGQSRSEACTESARPSRSTGRPAARRRRRMLSTALTSHGTSLQGKSRALSARSQEQEHSV